MKKTVFCIGSIDFSFLEDSSYNLKTHPKDQPKILNQFGKIHVLIIEAVDLTLSFLLIKELRQHSLYKQIPLIVFSKTYSHLMSIKCNISSVNAYVTTKDLCSDLILSYLSETEYAQEQTATGSSLSAHLLNEHRTCAPLLENRFFELILSANDLKHSIYEILQLFKTICNADIIILMLPYRQSSSAYIDSSDLIDSRIFHDFYNFCIHDFHLNFSSADIQNIEQIFLSKELNKTITGSRLRKLIASYFYVPVIDSDYAAMATLHFGSFSNDHFSNTHINELLYEMSLRLGFILDKIIKIENSLKERTDLLNLFSKFLPESIIQNLISETDQGKRTERKRLAILFSDIRSFTTITEMNKADDVIQFLNEYFEEMVKCIKEAGGVIDKFIGDAIVAVFGLQESMDSPAQQALQAADNMLMKQSKLQPQRVLLENKQFSIGVGLHIGESIVGNIGSDSKMAYTTVGEVSTIAEECEGLTKRYKTPLLFTQDFFNALHDSMGSSQAVEVDTQKHLYTLSKFVFNKRN